MDFPLVDHKGAQFVENPRSKFSAYYGYYDFF